MNISYSKPCPKCNGMGFVNQASNSEESLMKLKSGQLIFCRDNTISSWICRFFQGEFNFSHVCTLEVDDKGFLQILTATGTTFKRLGFTDYLHDKDWVIVDRQNTHLSDTQRQQIVNYLKLHYLKKFYPYSELIWMFIRKLAGKEPDISHKSLVSNAFCSEGVYLAYQSVEVELLKPTGMLPPELITPRDIWEANDWDIIDTNIPYYNRIIWNKTK